MWIFEKLDYIKISMLSHSKLERKRSFIVKSFVVDFIYYHSEYSYSIDSRFLFLVIYSNQLLSGDRWIPVTQGQ